MWQTFRRVLRGIPSTPPSRPAARPHALHIAPVYPPIDTGIDALSLVEVLATQDRLIERIRQSCGLASAEFARLMVPAIEAFAGYVHLLPATRCANHRGAGGMLRLGLEVGFYSLQAADGVIFAGHESTERKRMLEARWRYAAFLAGMTCDLYRVLNDMVVTDPAGAEWPAYQNGLADWLAKGARQRLHVHWVDTCHRGAPEQGANALVFNRVIPADGLQYLREGGQKILTATLCVVTGAVIPAEQSSLQQIVLDVRRKVIEKDAGVQPDLYGALTVGVHLEPYLIDGMRRLVRSGAWQVNEREARLWYGVDGLYLAWRTAASEILDLLRLDRIPGVPQDRDTLCEMLVRAAVIEPDADGNALRTIDSPGMQDLAVVKIRNPDLLFQDPEGVPAPLREFLERTPVPPPPAAAPNPPASAPAAPPVAESASDLVGAGSPATDTARIDAPAAPEPAARGQAIVSGAAPASDLEQRPQLPGAVAQRLLRLPRATADLMRLLLNEYRGGERRMMFQTGQGLAIVAEYMNSHGVSGPEAARHLQEAGWLYRDPRRPAARAHALDIEGKPVQCFVLSAAIARDLGFG
jgi:conjugal transfer pilus assembly protein TraI